MKYARNQRYSSMHNYEGTFATQRATPMAEVAPLSRGELRGANTNFRKSVAVEEQLTIISRRNRQADYEYPEDEMREFLQRNPSSLLHYAPVNEASHYLEIHFGAVQPSLPEEDKGRGEEEDKEGNDNEVDTTRSRCRLPLRLPRGWKKLPHILSKTTKRRSVTMPLAAAQYNAQPCYKRKSSCHHSL